MSDVIYEERYDNILSCYYLGLILNIVLSCLFGIPFCIWEYVIGHVHLLFVFTGFCGYISLVLVFYSMLYLSICKDYQKISFYFCLEWCLLSCCHFSLCGDANATLLTACCWHSAADSF